MCFLIVILIFNINTILLKPKQLAIGLPQGVHEFNIHSVSSMD